MVIMVSLYNSKVVLLYDNKWFDFVLLLLMGRYELFSCGITDNNFVVTWAWFNGELPEFFGPVDTSD